MGRLKNGPFSGFTGRTGSLVGTRKKGKWIMSAVRATATPPPTIKQMGQQMRFGLMTSWVAPLGELINIGFQDYDAKMSARNAAIKYNLDHAVVGTYPNYSIDYPQVRLSRGLLGLPSQIEVATGTGFSLDFSWGATISGYKSKPTDKMAFCAYSQLEERWVLALGPVTRSAMAYNMLFPAELSGQAVICYAVCYSEDMKTVSESLCLGTAHIA